MNVEKLIEVMIESPETIPALIPSLVEQYKPTIYTICNEIHNMMKDYANNTEYFETNAKIKKQQFDAYVKAGFNEDQAIAFIINDNLKLMENVKKQSSNISKNSSKR